MPHQSLIGITYDRMNCYQLVREFYRKLEIELPQEPSFERWNKVEAPRYGDLAVFASGNAGAGVADGVGVCVDTDRVLIARKGHDSIVARRRNLTGEFLGYYRRDE